MKVLFFVNTQFNMSDNSKLGGIETLNIELFNHFKKKDIFVFLSNKISNKILTIKWDVVISSNDARIFDKIKSKRKILWLHNKLQIEKSLRKKQFFSILRNKLEAVFVSKYLEANTSELYFFNKRIVISNFLPKIFTKRKVIKKIYAKKIFIWSVQRNRGLDYVLDLWINKINHNYKNAELHIFSIKQKNKKQYEKYNIFFHGRVKRSILLNYYKRSSGTICLGYDETFCLNAIESMSMGVPVISLRKTALNELIKNNKNGFKIKDLSDLKKIIIKLINLNQNKRIKLTESTIRFSKKYHSMNIFKKWDDLILK